ncbi:RDD family protein [Planctomycetes bacterium Pla163]|uniref:RDD family protein n=1 Tax=Rohdeia mirabilis TaxID=2528008 RepID=A0A518CW77_9BACT|nr:RDD family protein [Planctomycetes bacterium Pla163]
MPDRDAIDPYAPPASQVAEPVHATSRALFLARPSQRLGAFLIDGLLLPSGFALLALIVATVVGVFLAAPDPTMAGIAIWSTFGGSLLLYLLIQGILVGRGGWTVGKRIVGLRVLRSDGRRVDLLHGFWMRLVFWLALLFLLSLVSFGVLGLLLFLVDAFTIYSDRHRTLRDRLCGTIVVTS